MSWIEAYLDNHYTYQISAALIYSIIIFFLYLDFEPGIVPIVPNLLILIFAFVILSQLVILSKIVNPEYHSTRSVLTTLLLSSFPPILATKLLIHWTKSQKREGSDSILVLTGIIFTLIFSLLSLFFILLILLALAIDPIPGHGLYLITVGIWGILGIVIGKSKLLYHSEITIPISKDDQTGHSYQKEFSKFFTKLYLTRKRRIIAYNLIVSLFILFILISNSINLQPIGVDYKIDDEHRQGDIDLIMKIEKDADGIANQFSITLDFDLTNSPILLSLSVINQQKELVKDHFGKFNYQAVSLELNDTINNLLKFGNDFVDSQIGQTSFLNETVYQNADKVLFQILFHPIYIKNYVRNIVLIANDEPLLWIIQNANWQQT